MTTKFFPAKFPTKKCKCGRMGKKTAWSQRGCEPRLREFECPDGHRFYVPLTTWELEVEQYLGIHYPKR